MLVRRAQEERDRRPQMPGSSCGIKTIGCKSTALMPVNDGSSTGLQDANIRSVKSMSQLFIERILISVHCARRGGKLASADVHLETTAKAGGKHWAPSISSEM
jgi:hypothetical protein